MLLTGGPPSLSARVDVHFPLDRAHTLASSCVSPPFHLSWLVVTSTSPCPVAACTSSYLVIFVCPVWVQRERAPLCPFRLATPMRNHTLSRSSPHYFNRFACIISPTSPFRPSPPRNGFSGNDIVFLSVGEYAIAALVSFLARHVCPFPSRDSLIPFSCLFFS